MIEVEVKAACRDLGPKLSELGAQMLREEEHEDIYFNSPWRDFRSSDEALRVRKVGGRFCLTYKGPRVDHTTKTREEIESPVSPEILGILERLGFREAAVVRKKRRIFSLEGFTVCLDCVEGLGNFIEVESGSLADRDGIFRLLEKLGVSREDTIRQSYVELLEGCR